MRENIDIREKAKDKGVFLWEVAYALGISEPTMTRKLRRELSVDEKSKISFIIDKIAREKENVAV